MKKLLALAVIVLGGMTAQANQVTDLDHGKKKGIRYNQSQAVTFVQRGIQFFVYTDGRFDFELPRQFGRRGHYGNQQAPGSTYGVNFPYQSNRLIRYDHFGNIKQVGRNPIFYNRRGMVNQIGQIALRYRHGRLFRIGSMFIEYDRRGRIRGLNGQIYQGHTGCGICGIDGCSANHFDYAPSYNGHQSWNHNGNLNSIGRRDKHPNTFKQKKEKKKRNRVAYDDDND